MKVGKLRDYFGRMHFHSRAVCIAAKNADFDAGTDLLITDSDKRLFIDAHKRHIQDDFQLQ